MCFKKIALRNAFADNVRRCPCCGIQLVWKSNIVNVQKNLATVDHIVPKSRGGSDIHTNMFVMCRSCNESRGNTCFVTFVTSRGVSKIRAEELYKTAHIETLKNIIHQQFQNVYSDRNDMIRINKRRRKYIKMIADNYTNYFDDYLPEFKLIENMIK